MTTMKEVLDTIFEEDEDLDDENPRRPKKIDLVNLRGLGYYSAGSGGSATTQSPLFDVFSRTLPEYKFRIVSAANKILGKNWKEKIGEAFKVGPGGIDQMIKSHWDAYWTDFETLEKIAFLYDLYQKGDADGYNDDASAQWLFTDPGYKSLDGSYDDEMDRKKRIRKDSDFEEFRQEAWDGEGGDEDQDG